MITYPWVCNKEQTDQGYTGWPSTTMKKFDFIQAAWGGSGNWGRGNAVPFSPNEGYIDCYYDNEPWSGGHADSTVPPPLWEAYMFWAETPGSDYIWGYKVAAKGPRGAGDVVVRSQAQFAADIKVSSGYGPFKLNLIKQFP